MQRVWTILFVCQACFAFPVAAAAWDYNHAVQSLRDDTTPTQMASYDHATGQYVVQQYVVMVPVDAMDGHGSTPLAARKVQIPGESYREYMLMNGN